MTSISYLKVVLQKKEAWILKKIDSHNSVVVLYILKTLVSPKLLVQQ